MNQALKEAAENASHTWLIGLVTAVFMAFFLGLVIWLWIRRDKGDFDEAARLPLSDDDDA